MQFSCSVVSDSLWPHGLQHTRPSCPSPTPGVYSNSCPLSQWYHPTISSSVVPSYSYLQSFPTSGSFQMSQFFPFCDQSIGVSASGSVLPMNIKDRFPLRLTCLTSFQSKGLSRVFSNTTVQKPKDFWSLSPGKVNPCDTTLCSHHQPIRELCTIWSHTLQPSPPSPDFKMLCQNILGSSRLFRAWISLSLCLALQ